MFKRTALTLGLMAALASAAFAAPVKAKVVSVTGKNIVLKVDGEVAAWIKKGIQVKLNKKFAGKITEVKDDTVTVSSPKAEELKADEAVTFDKNTAAAGC
jgi:type 1 fimbria pilin